MPDYLPDPDHPGQHIDIIELVRRYPDRPPPVNVEGLLRRDLWTRQEALLILCGLAPHNVVHSGLPIGTIGGGIVYLDGIASAQLDALGLQHPRAQDWLPEFETLRRYAEGHRMDERKTPAEWLAWANSKGFTPYWQAKEAASDSDFFAQVIRQEAARIASEARGYTVSPDAFNVEQYDSASGLLDAIALRPHNQAPPCVWAHWFALELAELNGQPQADRMHAHRFEQAIVHAARKGDLRMCTHDAVGAPVDVTPDMPDDAIAQRLGLKSADLRAWAELHWPELAASRLLKEPTDGEAGRDEAARRAAGRYTLREAAKEIAKQGRANWGNVLRRLSDAWASGDLPAYRPGSTVRSTPEESALHRYYMEAYWKDLNAWLANKMPRIGFKFPKPEGDTEIGGDELAGFEEALEEEWNGGPIDWERWTVKSATLTAQQAARLMAGLDPERFEQLAFTKSDKAGPAKAHARRLEQLAEAEDPPKERDAPAGWLAWADAKRERVHSPYRVAIEQAAKGAAPAEQAATVAAQGTPAEQWADAKGDMKRRRELAHDMVKRCQGNKTKAAERLGTATAQLYRALKWEPQHSKRGSVAFPLDQLTGGPRRT